MELKVFCNKLNNLKKLYMNITHIPDNKIMYIDIFTSIFVHNSFISKWIYDLNTFYANSISDINKNLIKDIQLFIKKNNIIFDTYCNDYLILTSNEIYNGTILDKDFNVIIETDKQDQTYYFYRYNSITNKIIVTTNIKILTDEEQLKFINTLSMSEKKELIEFNHLVFNKCI